MKWQNRLGNTHPTNWAIRAMLSSVISADSFAGEKERGTLESLLFSPVNLPTLFTNKVLATQIPSLVISFFTFLLAVLVVNLVGFPLMGRNFFPHVSWLPLMLTLFESQVR